MDPRITALNSTTFSGRRLTRRQVAEVQETVDLLPNDSRNELCKTICEHLNWVTAKGDYKVGACMGMLEHLEQHGIVRLPEKRQNMVRPDSSKPVWSSASDPGPLISAPLGELQPLGLELVTDTEGRQLWNACVDRHHYLGYRRPFGAHIRYFLTDCRGRRLGCLLFDAATKSLPCRERWIGWNDRSRDRNRPLVVTNSRWLVFPWVRSKNLASCALSLATRRLGDDWQELHGYRPVLCETFVEEDRFRATCYRAANWERIGETGGDKGKSIKGVYVLPLCRDSREVLRGEHRDAAKPARPKTTAERGRSGGSCRRFTRQWETLVAAATAVAEREDARWQKRRRVFSTLLIMLFVFRLVVAPRRQGYRATLCELWEQCQQSDIALPQDEPPAASSVSEAREKLDEAAFKTLHREILAHSPDDPLWKGNRIFAVDGSKITLPRELLHAGYRIPNDNTHYPQGMISTLYRLHTRMPVDFDLFSHENERAAALTHLDHAAKGDVIVYDRGYWSFEMALVHHLRRLDFVFRIKNNTNPAFAAFAASRESDRIITLKAPRDATELRGRSLRIRLVKYTVADTEYCLATSLHDSRYTVPALSDLYHGRWQTEEGYKTDKAVIESFHAKSERGVRQELYAAFILITLARMFANRCDHDINHNANDDLPAMRTNFKNGMRLMGREIEAMFLRQSQMVAQSVRRIMTGLSRCIQRERPGRSYKRESRQPRSKWQKRTAA